MATRHRRIYERRLTDGTLRYDVKAHIADPLTGRRRPVTKTFERVRDAKAWLAQQEADSSRGVAVTRDRRTLASWLDEWLAIHRPHVKETTLAQYQGTIKNHIIPYMGQERLRDVTAARIQRHYSDLLAAGVGIRTIRFVHDRLDQALEQARRLKLIAANPVGDAVAPSYEAPRRDVWDDDEVGRFLAVAHESRYGPIWLVALETGLRRGELCGLRWQDVDVARSVLHVRQAVTYLNGRVHFTTPKSGHSRDVDVDSTLIDALLAHKRVQNEQRLKDGELWHNCDLVFTARYGLPIHPDVLRPHFVRLCERAGVRVVHIHDLRHTHATMLLQRGVEVNVVQERLGHADASVTLNTYAHVLPSRHKEVASMVARMLHGKALDG